MSLETLALISLLLAALPAALLTWNLFLVRPLPPPDDEPTRGTASVSVLIPARNEAANIAAALDSVLTNRGVEMEVLVLDDGSTDDTGAIAEYYASRDPRVRRFTGPPLPDGWCGKQHACHVLAGMARHPWLVFMDADVRLAPDALARMTGFMRRTEVALASGVPRQVTGTVLERLLIPLVHFFLLGFLPVWRMRRCSKPAYAAGCGQLFVAAADAYRRVGGHGQIRSTLHDGLKLPRLFRQSGFRTDLFDATDAASCRMYDSAREVVAGLMKNAHEALASPRLIVPMTLLLLGGQVLPWLLVPGGFLSAPATTGFALAAVALTLLSRLLCAWRFRQSLAGALLHPLSVALLVGIQWTAFVRKVLGKSTSWRGRRYSAGPVKRSPVGPGKPAVLQQGASG